MWIYTLSAEWSLKCGHYLKYCLPFKHCLNTNENFKSLHSLNQLPTHCPIIVWFLCIAGTWHTRSRIKYGNVTVTSHVPIILFLYHGPARHYWVHTLQTGSYSSTMQWRLHIWANRQQNEQLFGICSMQNCATRCKPPHSEITPPPWASTCYIWPSTSSGSPWPSYEPFPPL
jgi:hypothetical protein